MPYPRGVYDGIRRVFLLNETKDNETMPSKTISSLVLSENATVFRIQSYVFAPAPASCGESLGSAIWPEEVVLNLASIRWYSWTNLMRRFLNCALKAITSENEQRIYKMCIMTRFCLVSARPILPLVDFQMSSA